MTHYYSHHTLLTILQDNEKIKQQAKKEVQQLEEVKNTKIIELEKELAILKEMYEIKQEEKEQR